MDQRNPFADFLMRLAGWGDYKTDRESAKITTDTVPQYMSQFFDDRSLPVAFASS
jgi:hypothetical protein